MKQQATGRKGGLDGSGVEGGAKSVRAVPSPAPSLEALLAL